MFRTIVWATDGSELADQALEVAKPLAWRDGSQLVVLHVDRLLYGRAGGQSVLADEEDVREKLQAQVEQLRLDEIDARLEVSLDTSSAVADEIARLAAELHADLIVIATHGRGAVGTLVHGSVAKQVLHHAQCPVLVVPVLHLTHAGNATEELARVRVPD